MKKLTITYRIVTGLFAAFILFGAIPNALSSAQSVEIFAHLGYPAYLVPFIGIAKILAVVALLVPGRPKLKERAYAGLMFDLIGATYSMIAVGDPVSGRIVMILPIAFAGASYRLYHQKMDA